MKRIMLFICLAALAVQIIALTALGRADTETYNIIRDMKCGIGEKYEIVSSMVEKCRDLISELEKWNGILAEQIIDQIIEERRMAENLYDRKAELNEDLILDIREKRKLSDKKRCKTVEELRSLDDKIAECIGRIKSHILITDTLLTDVMAMAIARVEEKKAFAKDVSEGK
jgi:hypothetical protein